MVPFAAPVRRLVARMLIPSERARMMAAWRSVDSLFMPTNLGECFKHSQYQISP